MHSCELYFVVMPCRTWMALKDHTKPMLPASVYCLLSHDPLYSHLNQDYDRYNTKLLNLSRKIPLPVLLFVYLDYCMAFRSFFFVLFHRRDSLSKRCAEVAVCIR